MKTDKIAMVMATVLAAVWGPTVMAADAAENEMVKEEGWGRWTFSAGPSWRARVKLSTSGTAYATPLVNPGNTDNKPTAGQVDGQVDDPEAGNTSPEGQKLYYTTVDNTEYDFTAGSGVASLNQSDVERPMGLYLQGGYDFYQGESVSVGLNLKFAGYWNLRSSGSGSVSAGRLVTHQFQDVYYYENDPVVTGDPATDGIDEYSDLASSPNEHNETSTSADIGASRAYSTRLRSDLYQIGIGPKVTWSAFDGWCEPLSWLDLYAGADVLFNFAYNRLEADGHSTSDTDFLIGFGGNVGFVGNLTDWCGVYGQVGYEWIDKSDVSCGGFKGEVDYSSLVLSAGVQFRF